MKSVLGSTFTFFIVVFLFASCDKADDFQHRNPPVAEAGSAQTIQLPVNSATLTAPGAQKMAKSPGIYGVWFQVPMYQL